jgi:hypothetical protein
MFHRGVAAAGVALHRIRIEIMTLSPDNTLHMLRHTVATLAYRGGKAIRGAPGGFSEYSASPGSRTPGQILAHVCDLFDWATKMADGVHEWRNTPPQSWEKDCARFFAGLEAFDRRLANGAAIGMDAEKLFQGPVADALTHIGQIAMLRRMAGAPIRGENYVKAQIAVGRVGADQPTPVFEFD